TLQLAKKGFTDGAGVFSAHKSLDGQPLLGRGGSDRKIAYAFQRHSEGARNGGGSQGQYIHFGPERLERFLLPHPKAMFLVDDDQPQLLECDILGKDFVGADDYVDGAVINALYSRRDFLA